jgi:hypothetical protein
MSRGQAGGDPPKAHVGLDQDEVAYAARVGRAGSGLEHIPAILRMEHRRTRNDASGRKRPEKGSGASKPAGVGNESKMTR